MARLVLITLGSFGCRLIFLLNLRQFPPQADLLPFLVLDGVAEVGAPWLVSSFGSNSKAAQVCISELGLFAGWGFSVAMRAPSLRGAVVVELVIDFVVFERGTERSRDGAGDTEAFVAVVQDVQECEGSVLVDLW